MAYNLWEKVQMAAQNKVLSSSPPLPIQSNRHDYYDQLG
jgi:hypothetical protein